MFPGQKAIPLKIISMKMYGKKTFSTSCDFRKKYSCISFTLRTFLDRHCLGILFSNKAFPRRVLGLAWRGDPAKKSGICQKRQPGTGVNLNSLFITLRTETMERIPLRMGILNLLHEILHAFGASHDPKGVLPFALVLCIIIIRERVFKYKS